MITPIGHGPRASKHAHALDHRLGARGALPAYDLPKADVKITAALPAQIGDAPLRD